MDGSAGLLEIARLLRDGADVARDGAMLRPRDAARLEALADDAVALAEQAEDVAYGAPLAVAMMRERHGLG